MTSRASASSDDFSDAATAADRPMTADEMSSIKRSIAHCKIDTLRAEVRTYPELVEGMDVNLLTLEQLKSIAFDGRTANRNVPASKATTGGSRTTWAATRQSTAAPLDDDDDKTIETTYQPPPPPQSSAPATDISSIMAMMMTMMQAEREAQRLREEKAEHLRRDDLKAEREAQRLREEKAEKARLRAEQLRQDELKAER